MLDNAETVAGGIDYSHGTVNVDNETGIHYGIISQNDVLEAWCDKSELQYGKPTCGYCGTELPIDYDTDDMPYMCTHCGKITEQDWELYPDEPDEPHAFIFENEEYILESCFNNTEIFVLKSPYYMRCRFCSPCAPGAGDINTPDENGILAYCLGPDWFEDPPEYKIYRVDNHEEVV